MNFEFGGTMKKHAALRKEHPLVVKKAIAENDIHLLSHLGRKGAMQANDNREARKAFDEHLALKRIQGDVEMRKQANEHIVPIDADDERDAA
jgi:hypothetical protein